MMFLTMFLCSSPFCVLCNALWYVIGTLHFDVPLFETYKINLHKDLVKPCIHPSIYPSVSLSLPFLFFLPCLFLRQGLKFKPRLALNLKWSSCLCLPNAGITDLCHWVGLFLLCFGVLFCLTFISLSPENWPQLCQNLCLLKSQAFLSCAWRSCRWGAGRDLPLPIELPLCPVGLQIFAFFFPKLFRTLLEFH